MQLGIVNGGRVKALIYIVEDDNDVAGLIKFNLEASGFLTAGFVRGDEGFRQAMSNPPAPFLLGVLVPGMDGITLCKRIRESQKTKRVPGIFFSPKKSGD